MSGHVGGQRQGQGNVEEQAVPRPSLLQRINPTIKLVACVLVAVALTLMFDPVTPLAVFLVTLAVGRLLGGLSLASQLRPLWVLLAAGLAILVANVLFNKANATATAIVSWGAIKVTAPALWAAGSLWLRLLCFALVSLVFVRTTEPHHLLLSLVHQLRLNYRVAFGVLVGYRMLPLLGVDFQTIRAAQRLRGAGEKGLVSHPIWWLRRYAIPLLAGGVRRAGRVALAMDARAFGASPARTYRVHIGVARRDWIFLALVVAVLGGILAATVLSGLGRIAVGWSLVWRCSTAQIMGWSQGSMTSTCRSVSRRSQHPSGYRSPGLAG